MRAILPDLMLAKVTHYAVYSLTFGRMGDGFSSIEPTVVNLFQVAVQVWCEETMQNCWGHSIAKNGKLACYFWTDVYVWNVHINSR